MTPFFCDMERVTTLRTAAARWIGTPFLESCGSQARPGVCADCCWVVMPLQHMGAIGAVPWPKRYVSRGGGSRMLEILIDTLDHTERLSRVWLRSQGSVVSVDQIRAGDLLVFSTGTRLHHMAIVMGDGTMVHSWEGEIQQASAFDHLDLVYAVYRPMAKQ